MPVAAAARGSRVTRRLIRLSRTGPTCSAQERSGRVVRIGSITSAGRSINHSIKLAG